MIHIIIRDKLRWCLQPPSQSDPTLTTKPSGLTTASRSLKVTDEYNSDQSNLVWFTSTRGGISREPARACQCAQEGNQPWGWFALFLLWCAICLYSVLFAKWQIYCTYWYGTLNLLHNIPIPTPTRPSMTNISFHKYLTKYLPNTFFTNVPLRSTLTQSSMTTLVRWAQAALDWQSRLKAPLRLILFKNNPLPFLICIWKRCADTQTTWS